MNNFKKAQDYYQRALRLAESYQPAIVGLARIAMVNENNKKLKNLIAKMSREVRMTYGFDTNTKPSSRATFGDSGKKLFWVIGE